MPREIELRLEWLCDQNQPRTTAAELVEHLGVSEGTVYRYLENRWPVLDRTVIERLADFFQCDAASLFTTKESAFFDPFRSLSGNESFPGHPTAIYLRRPDANTEHKGRPNSFRDNNAINRINELLEEGVPDLHWAYEHAETTNQFEAWLLQNCIVVGSPRVNPAAEMAICRIFDVAPFSPGPHKELPFTFKVDPSSPLRPSSIVEASTTGQLGVWLRDYDTLLPVNTLTPNQFFKQRIRDGRDWGLVIVCNHQYVPGPPRKLIVLCGFGGIGTDAVAQILSRQYSDLEPRSNGVVWGIVEAVYQKKRDSTKRELSRISWRYRKGGRCPLDFKKKP